MGMIADRCNTLRIVCDDSVLIGHVGEDMPSIVEFAVESGFDPFRSLAVEGHRLDAVKRHRRSDIVPRDVECRGVEHDAIVEE